MIWTLLLQYFTRLETALWKKKGHTATATAESFSRQVLLVCFTANIGNGLVAQIRPDAETPALVQRIKAPLIGTIIVTGRGRIRGSNEVTGKRNTDESDTRGRLLQRRGNTSCGAFLAGRINYLQQNVQSALALTLSEFPKVSWAAGAASKKRLSSLVLCYCRDGSNKPKAEQTDDRLAAA